jgi:hypothetical protein
VDFNYPLGLSIIHDFLAANIWPWDLCSPKIQIHKGWDIVAIQFHEWAHPDGHVMSGIVTMFPEMHPLYACPFLPSHIVPKVPLNPFVYYLSLLICLGVLRNITLWTD